MRGILLGIVGLVLLGAVFSGVSEGQNPTPPYRDAYAEARVP